MRFVRTLAISVLPLLALFLDTASTRAFAAQALPPSIEKLLIPADLTPPSTEEWITDRSSSPVATSYYQTWVIRFRQAASWHESAIDPSKFRQAILATDIDKTGVLTGAALLQDTGSVELDAYILETVERGTSFPPPPTALANTGRRLRVVASVGFIYGHGRLKPIVPVNVIATYRFQRAIVDALRGQFSLARIPVKGNASVVLELDVDSGHIIASRLATPSGNDALDNWVLRSADRIATYIVGPSRPSERSSLRIPLDFQP